MVRLIGILTGSAFAVALLILTLGVPDFATTRENGLDDEGPAIAKARPESTWTLSPETPEPAPPPFPETPPETSAGTEAEPDRAEPAVPDDAPVVADAIGPAAPGAAAESAPARTAESPQRPASEPSAPEQNWYAFWSPFRSRIAAEGFIAELQRTTGLDYRVVKLKPGVYEVAFAYADDTDIHDKLAQISAATGLDVSGG